MKKKKKTPWKNVDHPNEEDGLEVVADGNVIIENERYIDDIDSQDEHHTSDEE